MLPTFVMFWNLLKEKKILSKHPWVCLRKIFHVDVLWKNKTHPTFHIGQAFGSNFMVLLIFSALFCTIVMVVKFIVVLYIGQMLHWGSGGNSSNRGESWLHCPWSEPYIERVSVNFDYKPFLCQKTHWRIQPIQAVLHNNNNNIYKAPNWQIIQGAEDRWGQSKSTNALTVKICAYWKKYHTP